jgi:hypothetical protein
VIGKRERGGSLHTRPPPTPHHPFFFFFGGGAGASAWSSLQGAPLCLAALAGYRLLSHAVVKPRSHTAEAAVAAAERLDRLLTS